MNRRNSHRGTDARRDRRRSVLLAVPPRIGRDHLVQMAIGFAVFAVFLANGAGLFDRLGEADLALSVPAVVSTPEFLLLLWVGIALAVLLPLLTPIAASVLTILAAVPVIYLGLSTATPRALLPMEYSLLTILMIFGVGILTSWFSEAHKKQQVINLFAQYVPPELVDIIIRNPDDFSLAGESRELTVMFCDVEEFTRLSERLEPRELAELLNTLFTPLTRIVYANRGTVDKYIGDEIMAFWGAPVDDENHARNAMAAAFEMQQAVRSLAPVFEARGWGPIRVGIGVNTGVMSVGNMGSEYRMAYTVVGDAVNLASRLQALTRVFDNHIIVGEATRRAFPGAFYRELGLVEVKGKDELVRIYEAFDPDTDPESTLVDNLKRHNEALRHYYSREWDEAAALFRKLRDRHPEDGLFGLYLEKIEGYRSLPPPPAWRGELRFEIK